MLFDSFCVSFNNCTCSQLMHIFTGGDGLCLLCQTCLSFWCHFHKFMFHLAKKFSLTSVNILLLS